MKAWTIALKDILVRLRDRRALMLAVITPLILTAIVGAAFSDTFDEGDQVPKLNIKIVVVNDDEGDLGQQITDLLMSPELADLFDPAEMADLEAARAQVESGGVIAVIHVPPDFSANIWLYDTPDSAASTNTKIYLYTDPVNTIRASIVKVLVSQIVVSFNSAALATQISIEQVLTAMPDVDVTTITTVAQQEIEVRFSEENLPRITINLSTSSGDPGLISTSLSYLALSFAVFFLTFNLFDNIRSLLDEQREGTLDRLMTTGTGISQLLLGKIGGALVLGVLQLGLLIIATRVLFNLSWGRSIPGLVLMIAAIAVAVTSLGTFLATLTSNIRQASVMASIVVLVSAAIGGSFFPPFGFPDWLQKLSHLTINRWAINGLVDLIIRDLTLGDVLLEVAVLISIAGVLFIISVYRFPRRIKR